MKSKVFIKLGQVFINKNNIDSIFRYDGKDENNINMGICINNIKYCLFKYPVTKQITEEQVNKLHTIIDKIIEQILSDSDIEEISLDGIDG